MPQMMKKRAKICLTDCLGESKQIKSLLFVVSLWLSPFLYSSDFLKTIALKGDVNAQLRLGFLYSKGDRQNLTEARYWMKKAANSGSPLACRYLGNAHLYGKGASKSLELSKKWFLMSVQCGDKNSLRSLAACYEIENHWSKSLVWYQLARDSGDQTVENAILRISKLVSEEERKLIPEMIKSSKEEIGIITPFLSNGSKEETPKVSQFKLNGEYSYWGESKKDIPHGYGKKKLGYKTIYQGEFNEGLEHGYGTSYDHEGKISFQGKWANGKPVKSKTGEEINFTNY